MSVYDPQRDEDGCSVHEEQKMENDVYWLFVAQLILRNINTLCR